MDSLAADSSPSVTEDQARTILQTWLSGASGIPSDLFDETLEIHNATSARLRFVHILEYRRENEVESRVVPAVEYEKIDLIRSPLAWNDELLEGFLSGSKETVSCRKCMGMGSVRCAKCSGIGGRLCPPTIACASCSGTGTRAPDSARCHSCNGSGVAKCVSCNGSGRIECGACKGSGQQRCGNCIGSGKVIRFIRGTISRDAKIKSMRTEQYAVAAAAVACAPRESYQELILRQELVNELPASLQTFFSDQIDSPWAPDERARMAMLDILQAVSVTYRYGDYRGIAYLIGRKPVLHINLSKQDRRQLRLINAGGRYNLIKLSIKKAGNTMRSSANTSINNARSKWVKRRKNTG
jgi:hypothetical protein